MKHVVGIKDKSMLLSERGGLQKDDPQVFNGEAEAEYAIRQYRALMRRRRRATSNLYIYVHSEYVA